MIIFVFIYLKNCDKMHHLKTLAKNMEIIYFENGLTLIDFEEKC